MPMKVPKGIDAEFYKSDLAVLIEKIRKENNKDIFIVGGGQVVGNESHTQQKEFRYQKAQKMFDLALNVLVEK